MIAAVTPVCCNSCTPLSPLCFCSATCNDKLSAQTCNSGRIKYVSSKSLIPILMVYLLLRHHYSVLIVVVCLHLICLIALKCAKMAACPDVKAHVHQFVIRCMYASFNPIYQRMPDCASQEVQVCTIAG